jgi:hypothetical protein
MATIILQGTITPEGHLQVELPDNLTSGQVEEEIRQPAVQGVTLGELLDSGLVCIWENRSDVEDSVAFARQLRRRASRRDVK